MITTEHTVTCDGCGLQGPTSDRTRTAAWRRASIDGWTATSDDLVLTTKHWCPECTKARRTESTTTKEPLS